MRHSEDAVTKPRISEQALAGALDRLRDLPVDTGVELVLIQAVERVSQVFGVTGAGLMFVDGENALRYVAASDEPGRTLELAQEQLGHGPCVDALVYGGLVAVEDLETDERWPGLADIVVPYGVRAVLGIPVILGGGSVGSLNVYLNQPRTWDDSEVNALRAFTTFIEHVVGAAVLAHKRERVVAQLQEALEHRVAIERAVGFVMARDHVDAVTAFDSLRRLARAQRRKVVDVASELLADVSP
jgi:GAF domain-containing protein